MFTQPYWVRSTEPFRLAVSPRPRGDDWLEDELASWKRNGVDTVVSLLQEQEAMEAGLSKEKQLCELHGILFKSFPIVDRSVPDSREDLARFLKDMASDWKSGKSILVHCRQGIGRSGMVAILLLVQSGASLEEAIRLVSLARGVAVPETPEQLAWLRSNLADVLK